MKTQIKTIVTLFLLVISAAGFSADPPARKNVQVLPAEAGILKILYYNPTVKNVTIRICNGDEIFFTDKVNVEDNGFIMRYDVSQVNDREFWVEVADKDTATKFRIMQDNWGKMVATYWNTPMAVSPVIASK